MPYCIKRPDNHYIYFYFVCIPTLPTNCLQVCYMWSFQWAWPFNIESSLTSGGIWLLLYFYLQKCTRNNTSWTPSLTTFYYYENHWPSTNYHYTKKLLRRNFTSVWPKSFYIVFILAYNITLYLYNVYILKLFKRLSFMGNQLHLKINRKTCC